MSDRPEAHGADEEIDWAALEAEFANPSTQLPATQLPAIKILGAAPASFNRIKVEVPSAEYIMAMRWPHNVVANVGHYYREKVPQGVATPAETRPGSKLFIPFRTILALIVGLALLTAGLVLAAYEFIPLLALIYLVIAGGGLFVSAAGFLVHMHREGTRRAETGSG